MQRVATNRRLHARHQSCQTSHGIGRHIAILNYGLPNRRLRDLLGMVALPEILFLPNRLPVAVWLDLFGQSQVGSVCADGWLDAIAFPPLPGGMARTGRDVYSHDGNAASEIADPGFESDWFFVGAFLPGSIERALAGRFAAPLGS